MESIFTIFWNKLDNTDREKPNDPNASSFNNKIKTYRI